MSTNFRIILCLLLLILFTQILPAQEISPQRLFLKSALIPGWGELSVGNNTGYIFLSAEIMLWAAQFYFNEEEKMKLSEAYKYAIKYAHIDPDLENNDTYLYHLSKYMSYGFDAGGYNSHILEEAEGITDPVLKEEFIQNNIYSDEFYWEWDSKERKRRYSIMRKDASTFADYAKSIGGVIIANHIISAINALRVGAAKKRTSFRVTIDKDLNPQFLCTYKF